MRFEFDSLPKAFAGANLACQNSDATYKRAAMESPVEKPAFIKFNNVSGSTITLKLSDISYLEEHRDRFVVHIVGPAVINIDRLAYDMIVAFLQ